MTPRPRKTPSKRSTEPLSDDGALAGIAPASEEPHYTEQLAVAQRRAASERSRRDPGDLYHVDNEEDEDDGVIPDERRMGAGTLVLAAIAIILAASAVAGITMFLKKNDMLDSTLALLPWNRERTVQPVETGPTIPESVAATFRLALAPSDEDAPRLPLFVGRDLSTEVSVSASFPATGSVPSVGGRAKGFVTIVNTTPTTYTFVATTRVLSEDGVLFRLDSATPIPASGSVRAPVTADVAGPGGDIGPARFTIPGLGASMAALVYATSDEPMLGGAGGDVPAVSVDDLVNAGTTLRESAFAEATADFGSLVRATEAVHEALYVESDEVTTLPISGTPGASFDGALAVGIRTMTIPTNDVDALLQDAFRVTMPNGTAGAHELGVPAYYVTAFDTDAMIAEIRVEAPIRPPR